MVIENGFDQTSLREIAEHREDPDAQHVDPRAVPQGALRLQCA